MKLWCWYWMDMVFLGLGLSSSLDYIRASVQYAFDAFKNWLPVS